MKAVGLQSPDVSILSDEFLAEVRDTPKKNFAIEALKKLINGNVRSQAKSNVTQSKAFTERLEAAIGRYHSNALTTCASARRVDQPRQGHSGGALAWRGDRPDG